jgi:hypothetical protein
LYKFRYVNTISIISIKLGDLLNFSNFTIVWDGSIGRAGVDRSSLFLGRKYGRPNIDMPTLLTILI